MSEYFKILKWTQVLLPTIVALISLTLEAQEDYLSAPESCHPVTEARKCAVTKRQCLDKFQSLNLTVPDDKLINCSTSKQCQTNSLSHIRSCKDGGLLSIKELWKFLVNVASFLNSDKLQQKADKLKPIQKKILSQCGPSPINMKAFSNFIPTEPNKRNKKILENIEYSKCSNKIFKEVYGEEPSWKRLFEDIKKEMSLLGVKFSCFNTQAITELSCYLATGLTIGTVSGAHWVFPFVNGLRVAHKITKVRKTKNKWLKLDTTTNLSKKPVSLVWFPQKGQMKLRVGDKIYNSAFTQGLNKKSKGIKNWKAVERYGKKSNFRYLEFRVPVTEKEFQKLNKLVSQGKKGLTCSYGSCSLIKQATGHSPVGFPLSLSPTYTALALKIQSVLKKNKILSLTYLDQKKLLAAGKADSIKAKDLFNPTMPFEIGIPIVTTGGVLLVVSKNEETGKEENHYIPIDITDSSAADADLTNEAP